MKVEIYKDPHVEGIVPRKIDPVGVGGNIVLSYNSDVGFTVGEVQEAAERFFVCPACGSPIEVEVVYRPETLPKQQLMGVINAVIPVYSVERTEGFMYYEWRCRGEKDIGCPEESKWHDTTPPVLRQCAAE